MKKIIYSIPLIALLFTSCATTSTGSSKSLDIVGPGVLHLPVVADLEVSQQRVSYSKTFSVTGEVGSTAKNEVIRELLKQHNSDVLIEPIFESTKSGAKLELTVTGFPAKYKNFRTIQKSDIELIEATPGFIQKAEENISGVILNKKK